MGDISATTDIGPIGTGAPDGQGQLDRVNLTQNEIKQMADTSKDLRIQDAITDVAEAIKEEAGVDKLPEFALDRLDEIASQATGREGQGSLYSFLQRREEEQQVQEQPAPTPLPELSPAPAPPPTPALGPEEPTRPSPGTMPISPAVSGLAPFLDPSTTPSEVNTFGYGRMYGGPQNEEEQKRITEFANRLFSSQSEDPVASTEPTPQPVTPFDLSSVTDTTYTAPGAGQGTFTSDDTFLQQLGQYLGLGAESQESDILKALTGTEPVSVRPAYEKELKSLEEASKGFTAGEREALLGQKRQALAAESRLSGRTKALKGGQRLAALMGAQAGARSKQASAMEEFDKMQKERKLAAETGLQQTELDIAEMDRQRKESYLKNMREAVLALSNLKGQQRLYSEKE